MEQVVGIRFRDAGPISYGVAPDVALKINHYVIVQTGKGPEFGWVVREPIKLVHYQGDAAPLLTILRKATSADLGRWQQVREREQEAFQLARARARELDLGMKIVDARYNLDASHVTITFGAAGRVDFRPLIHVLATELRCRVQLHQVGQRDVAKLTGGLGRCGRALCCITWMTRFEAVGIKMAKEQSLPIDAQGLAGACGRLRCCLRFEYEQYREINRALPRISELVETPAGPATVIVGHRVKETVSVRYPNDQVHEWPLADITRIHSSRN
ncbi:MAG TPA: regulatory iron-sulfur-containing complex subunit RicT [Dehalococcoidia bacterium]|nr:regulatory iron-sulfur-containing complex subunit RicT [Dehalococcoidia bacterium]